MLDMRSRIIPVLLLRGQGLVKTRQFKSPAYVGDPLNTVRIFNEMDVDEIILLDICATPTESPPQFDLLKEIAAEALFPLAYGGGIASVRDAVAVLESGFERVVVNSLCSSAPAVVRELSEELGSSSVVGSMDVLSHWLHGEMIRLQGRQAAKKYSAVDWARRLEDLGVGEIMLNSVNRDGEMTGYDFDLIRRVSQAVSVPVIACGGAKSFADLSAAIQNGASAAAGGSVFVFKGKHRGVLIQYVSDADRSEKE